MLIVPHASRCEGRTDGDQHGVDSASHRGEQITVAAVPGRVKLQPVEAIQALERRTACRLLRDLCGSLSHILGHVEVADQQACDWQVRVPLLDMQAGQEN